MYNASRGILYTAPPSPEDETEPENDAESATPASADAASPGETGLAADD